MTTPTLLGISGSLRKASTNTKLVREAARLFGDCTYVEADLHMPLYDGDVEASEGVPEAAQLIARQIAEADAVVISTPEYNKAPPRCVEERAGLGQPGRGASVGRQTRRRDIRGCRTGRG